jgi:hypothetical protein
LRAQLLYEKKALNARSGQRNQKYCPKIGDHIHQFYDSRTLRIEIPEDQKDVAEEKDEYTRC